MTRIRTRTAPDRRMGPVGSPNWHAMLDGAEAILRDDGYAALTSRAIADHIGVKQRLVYYYFSTMDELIVQTFRRLSARELERLEGAAASSQPLQEIWDICIHTADARLIYEFMALTNRIEGLRAEVIAFIKESRRLQTAALSDAMKSSARRGPLTPEAAALIATSLALAINREVELGVSNGHRPALDAIGQFLQQLGASETRRRPASKKTNAKKALK